MLEDIADKEFLEILGKTPVQLSKAEDNNRIFAIPDGEGGFNICDMSHDMLPQPERKKSKVNLTDVDSFIGYVNRHKQPSLSTIWVDADYEHCNMVVRCVFDDDGAESPQWRDHVATFRPLKTQEFRVWLSHSDVKMRQKDFAVFI